MKKTLIILFLLIPSLCFGASTAASVMGKATSAISTISGKAIADISTIAGVGVSAAGCTAYATSTSGTEADGQEVGYSTDYFQSGQGGWSPSSGTVSICKVVVAIRAVGDVSGKTYYAQLWTTGGSAELSSLVSNGQSTGVTGPASGNVEFTFSTAPQATAGTAYAITVRNCDTSACNDTTVNTSNYIIVRRVLADNITGHLKAFRSIGTVTAGSSSYDTKMTIYTQ